MATTVISLDEYASHAGLGSACAFAGLTVNRCNGFDDTRRGFYISAVRTAEQLIEDYLSRRGTSLRRSAKIIETKAPYVEIKTGAMLGTLHSRLVTASLSYDNCDPECNGWTDVSAVTPALAVGETLLSVAVEWPENEQRFGVKFYGLSTSPRIAAKARTWNFYDSDQNRLESVNLRVYTLRAAKPRAIWNAVSDACIDDGAPCPTVCVEGCVRKSIGTMFDLVEFPEPAMYTLGHVPARYEVDVVKPVVWQASITDAIVHLSNVFLPVEACDACTPMVKQKWEADNVVDKQGAYYLRNPFGILKPGAYTAATLVANSVSQLTAFRM